MQPWDRRPDDSLAAIADLARPRHHPRRGWTVWGQMVADDRGRIGVGSEVGPYQQTRQRLPLGLVVLAEIMGPVQTMTRMAMAMAMIAMVQLRKKVPSVPLAMSNFGELGRRLRLDLAMNRMVRPDRRCHHHRHLSVGAIPPQYPMDDTTDKDRQQKMIPSQFCLLR